MLLIDQSIRDYTALLASSAPAPGGGSAAALTGALGIALTGMVGALTEGRGKYAEHARFVAELLERAASIQEALLDLVDEDTVVFNKMSEAYKMPKADGEEKAARGEAIQTALKACTATPYKMMELCLRGIELTSDAVGRTNRNVASDLGVAAICLKAAAQGAWLNVLINIGSLRDADFASAYHEKGEAVIKKALPMADGVYEAVMGILK